MGSPEIQKGLTTLGFTFANKGSKIISLEKDVEIFYILFLMKLNKIWSQKVIL